MLGGSNSEIPVSCTLSKIIDRFKTHQGYLFVAKDISERKDKEKNDLRIVIATQEKERKRLANDLHDSLGQEINAIKMYMNSLVLMERKRIMKLLKQVMIILSNIGWKTLD